MLLGSKFQPCLYYLPATLPRCLHYMCWFFNWTTEVSQSDIYWEYNNHIMQVASYFKPSSTYCLPAVMWPRILSNGSYVYVDNFWVTKWGKKYFKWFLSSPQIWNKIELQRFWWVDRVPADHRFFCLFVFFNVGHSNVSNKINHMTWFTCAVITTPPCWLNYCIFWSETVINCEIKMLSSCLVYNFKSHEIAFNNVNNIIWMSCLYFVAKEENAGWRRKSEKRKLW